MSKAFTRESDDARERPDPAPRVSALPPGAKNYVTPSGAAAMQSELNRLREVERPRSAAAAAHDPEARAHLQRLDTRIRHLTESLQSAEIVSPPGAGEDRVRFGATVVARTDSGAETSYRIVGVDEVDLDRGWVSWASPIARALLGARAGERIRFKLPAGEETIEIVRITYE